MQTLKNRKRKFALSVKIVAMLSCLAIASVGFASWLVVHEPNTTTNAGDIEVAVTSATKLQLAVGAVKPGEGVVDGYNHKFVFGRPDPKPTTENFWLIPQGVGVESLSAAYKLTYTPENIPDGGKATLKLSFNGVVGGEVDKTKLAALISKGYLTLTVTFGDVSKTYNKTNPFPASGLVEVEKELDYEKLQDVTTLDFSITFAWGSAFGGENPENPYVYYNNMAHTNENAEEALEVLDEIATLVQGADEDDASDDLSYKVTVSAVLDLSNIDHDYN